MYNKRASVIGLLFHPIYIGHFQLDSAFRHNARGMNWFLPMESQNSILTLLGGRSVSNSQVTPTLLYLVLGVVWGQHWWVYQYTCKVPLLSKLHILPPLSAINDTIIPSLDTSYRNYTNYDIWLLSRLLIMLCYYHIHIGSLSRAGSWLTLVRSVSPNFLDMNQSVQICVLHRLVA